MRVAAKGFRDGFWAFLKKAQDRSKLPFRETTDTFITSPEGVLARDLGKYINFPGGGVDPGETPEQASVRETLEETGAQIADPEILETLEMVWPESWADSPKRKERFKQFQGERIHLVRAALQALGKPASTEGDAWENPGFIPPAQILKRLQEENPDPLMAGYREAQIRALQGLMNR